MNSVGDVAVDIIARSRELRGGAAVALVLLGLLGLAPGIVGAADEELTPAERKDLEQRAKEAIQQTNERYQAGKYRDATRLAEEALTILRRLYPPKQYPEGHPDLANSLSWLGLLLLEQGEYAKAEPFYRDALAMFQKLYPKERYPDGHPLLAQSLISLGALLEARGEYARAEPFLRDALAMFQKLYPKERYPDGHPLLAQSLSYLARLLQAQGEYAQAEPFFRDALAMLQRLYPKDRYPDGHPDLATSLNNLGGLLQDQGEYAGAEPFLRDALAMYQTLYPQERFPDGHPALATSLNNLGQLLQDQGQYGKAEPFLRDALAMKQKLYPEGRYPDGHPELAQSLNNLGGLLEAQGEYAKAEPFYRDALQMCQKRYPKERYPDGHPELAVSLNNLGYLLLEQGEYSKAEPFLRDALQMRQKLYPKGRYPDGHPYLATSLNNLGRLLQEQGEYTRAEPFYRDALAMRQKLYPKGRYPEGHPHLATSLNNLGRLLQEQGEYTRAEPFYRDALQMRQKLYPKGRYPDGHPHLAHSLNDLGLLLLAQGEYAKAEPFLRDALAMYQKLYPKGRYPEGHPHLAGSLHNLGSLLQAQGESARAEPFLRDALAIYEAHLRIYADLKAEAQALNRLAAFPVTRDVFLTVSRHLPPRAEHYQPVWQQKALLARVFERRHLDTLASTDDEARALVVELRSARERLARLAVVPLSDPKAHAERFQQLTQEKEEAEQRLARRLKVTAPARKQNAATPDDLLRALSPDAAFVDVLRYVSFDQDPKVPGQKGETWTRRYVAFVLRQGQPVQRVELGEAERIEEALKQWRREISDWRPDRKATPSGADARLSELVWQPLAKHIPANTATVYLSPDAALTALPWAALPGRDRGKVLLEEHALALVPHGPWLLQRLRTTPDKEGGLGALLALGAVAYGRAPTGGAKPLPEDIAAAAPKRGGRRAEWEDLKGTERELEQVIARAGQREVIVRKGADAGLAQVYRDLEKARHAHLATHGFFDEKGTRSVLQLTEEDYRRGRRGERVGAGLRSPLLLSGLVLAGANRKEQGKPDTWAADGGILLGEDIAGRNLHHMELAVLSACETGLGDVAGGEGVFGLQRAFHVAGCRNVVASLWQVDDEATAALMNLFYARLWHPDEAKRLPPLQALREAQLTLYRQPELVTQFARGEVRGPKGDKVVRIEDYAPPRPEEAKSGERKAHPRQWAAFVLSGDGR
jgi:CHAT domain-containing protein/Tfp pilus assembly protein PilF